MPHIIQDFSYPTRDETHAPLQWKSGVVFCINIITIPSQPQPIYHSLPLSLGALQKNKTKTRTRIPFLQRINDSSAKG